MCICGRMGTLLSRKKEEIIEWILKKIREFGKNVPERITEEDSISDFGISSAYAIILIEQLKEFTGCQINAKDLWVYPTIDKFAEYVESQSRKHKDEFVKEVEEEVEEELEGNFKDAEDQIAIIGIGCRFPNAKNKEEFWDVIYNGKDCITTRKYGEQEVSGGFIEELDKFDNKFFRILPREAELMDPQQRLLLEVTWEAFEDAGIVPKDYSGKDVGVYVGISSNDYANELMYNGLNNELYAVTGNAHSVAANRISYYYNFTGPSMSVDTACSSSLVALHNACSGIKNNDAEIAVVAGVNLILNNQITEVFQKAKMLSPDQRCHTFDEKANGYVRGEGVGVVILKSLKQAIKDRNRIYSVILGSAVNQDGRSNGLTAPNSKSQIQVMRKAMRVANIKADDIHYVEAHGTGTNLGDPIEAYSLGEAIGKYKKEKLRIGSVKTNIGHLEAAAGIAGVIKTALCIKKKSFVPSIHYQTLNSQIDADKLFLKVQTSTESWDGVSKRIAGVSSFGFGGTNAHVILGEAVATKETDVQVKKQKDYYVLPVSAFSEKSIQKNASHYKEWLMKHEEKDLAVLANTLGTYRTQFGNRVAVVVQNANEAVEQLDKLEKGLFSANILQGNSHKKIEKTKIAFIFSGQGPGKLLWNGKLLENPDFRQELDKCNVIFEKYSGWSVIDVIEKNTDKLFENTSISQPVIFCIQVSLANMLKKYGIEPTGVTGHSLGEVAAAYVSGRLTLEDAIKVVYNRSVIMEKLKGTGKMLSVMVSKEQAEAMLEERGYKEEVSVAVVNSMDSCVLAGKVEILEQIRVDYEQEKIRSTFLGVDYPFHGIQARELGKQISAKLRTVRVRPQTCNVYAAVTGEKANAHTFGGKYWGEQVHSTVQFASAIEKMVQDGYNVFIEINTQPLLTSYVKKKAENLKADVSIFQMLEKRLSQEKSIAYLLGKLYANHISVNWKEFYGDTGLGNSVPSYAWEQESFWFRRAENKADQVSHFVAVAKDEKIIDEKTEWNLCDKLKEAENEERQYQLIENFIKEQLAVVFHMDLNDIDEDVNLLQLGMDSLMAYDMKGIIDKQFSCDFPVIEFISGATVSSVVSYIIKNCISPVTVKSEPNLNSGVVKDLELSYMQKSLWVIYKNDNGNCAYNQHFCADIRGTVDEKSLEQAVTQLLKDNMELCSRFEETNLQVKKSYCDVQQLEPFRFEKEHIYTEDEIEKKIDQLTNTPFVLENGNLFLVYLLKKQEGYTIFVTAHHMVIDLGSITILLRELFINYQRLIEGKEPLKIVKRTYNELVREQNQFMESSAGKEQGAYWNKVLSGTLPVVDLAMKKRPDKISYNGSCYMSSIDEKLSEDIRSLARELGVTANTLIYSVYYLLVSRYTGEEDIIIGSSASIRGEMGYQDVVGHMINLLPVRMEVKGKLSFREYIEKANTVILEAIRNQQYPFSQMIEDIHPTVGQGFSPIVQIAFSQESLSAGDSAGMAKFIMGHNHNSSFSGLDFVARKANIKYTPYDLLLMAEMTGKNISFTWQYNTDLFELEDMEHMAEHFKNLLYAVSQNTSQPIGTYSMLTKEECHTLFDVFNEKKVPYDGRMFCQEFEKIVKQYPEYRAVSMHDDHVTYKEFNERINKTARYLLSIGLKKGDFIGVSLAKSIPTMELLMAILKIGCVYIPIDPEYPESRITFIINHAGIKLTVVNEDCDYIGWDVEGCSFQTIDAIVEARARFETSNLSEIEVLPHDLAYIIFTSGTTGTPKGVMIEHIGICNMVDGLNEGFQVRPASKVLQFASLSFDASIAEIFITFMMGGELVLRRKEEILPGGGLESVLKECEITEVILTPSVLLLTNPEGITKLRTILSAGESCSQEILKKWMNGRRFVNAYGPTESTVCASLKVCEPNEEITIGKAITKTKLYVVDQYMNPVPVGMPGELCISTIGLARGYFKNETLSSEKFVDNTIEEAGYEKVYKTSDIVRFNKAGDIRFCGRKDNQVKIRGFRIELDEIESILNRYKDVKEAVVIVKETCGEKTLVAFLASDSEENDYLAEAKQHVRKFVPHYMVPSHFVKLKDLPHSVSGKVDRKAIESMEIQLDEIQVDESSMTDTQKRVRKIWCNALHYNGITLTDDFYELGGHSLTAAQVRAEIEKEFFLKIEMSDIFEYSVLEEFCNRIDNLIQEKDNDDYEIIQKLGEKNYIPVTYAQNRLLFISKMSQDSSEYNICGDLNLTGKLDVPLFQKSYELLIERHDILHTVFFQDNKYFYQKVLSEYKNIQLEVIDLSGQDADSEEVNQVLAQVKKTRFELETGPLICSKLVKLSDTQYILGFAVHHIISDGWSVALMVDEWSEIYNALCENRKTELSEEHIQFSDYVIWQSEHIQGEYLEEIEDFWVEKMRGAQNSILQLPTDYRRPNIQTNNGDILYYEIGKELTGSLKSLCRDRQATMFMVLFSGFNVLLSKITNDYDINIGVPVAGRTRSETEDILGMFINMIVLRTSYDSNTKFSDLLESVKKDIIESMERQDMPFERLVEVLNPARNLMYSPLFQVMFNMLTVNSPKFNLKEVATTDRVQSAVDAKYDITLYAKEENERIEFQLVYNTDVFSKTHMKQLLTQYELLLAQIAAKPSVEIKEFTLFDQQQWNLVEKHTKHTDGEGYLPLHKMVEEAVKENSEGIAVSVQKEEITYNQLWINVCSLATYLDNSYKGDCVVIYAQRNEALVEYILACALTGKTFSVIDSSYPKERIIGMLEQIEFSCFVDITENEKDAEQLKDFINGKEAVYIRANEVECSQEVMPRLRSDGYYIMFTSGTTGKPNAIKSKIDCIAHFVFWYKKEFQILDSDRFSMLSGLGHDPIMRDIFVPLCTGASIHIPVAEQLIIPDSLYSWLIEKKITVIHQTPSILKLLTGKTLQSVRLVCFGGEKLTAWDLDIARKIMPQAKLINCYGATETPQIMSCFDATDFTGVQVPVGQGIDDVEIIVLDENRKRAGLYQVGEIFIQTKYLAEGYISNDNLNHEKFIAQKDDNEKMYCTGDMGYYNENGYVVVTGRKDMQLKVRGFRVEPEEIEHNIKEVLDARDVKVLINGKGKLVAFIAGVAEEKFDKAMLHRRLSSELPGYMIPEKYCRIEAIPLTKNGKADYDALLRLETVDVASSKESYSGTEEIVAMVWKESLGLEEIDLDSNFFEIGGYSFLLMEMYEKLSDKLTKKFEMVELFRYPTIRTFSGYIDSGSDKMPDMGTVKESAGKRKDALKAIRQKKRGKRN